MWYTLGKLFSISGTGVDILREPPLDEPITILPWLFVDSDEPWMDGLPVGSENPLFYDPRFNVYITDPDNRRWRKFNKNMLLNVMLMNPWSRAEIHAA